MSDPTRLVARSIFRAGIFMQVSGWLIAQITDGMQHVLGARHIFQIGQYVVGFDAVDVIDLLIFCARPNECRCDKAMDKKPYVLPVIAQDNHQITGRRLSAAEDAPCLGAGCSCFAADTPDVGNRVVGECINNAPFLAIETPIYRDRRIGVDRMFASSANPSRLAGGRPAFNARREDAAHILQVRRIQFGDMAEAALWAIGQLGPSASALILRMFSTFTADSLSKRSTWASAFSAGL